MSEVPTLINDLALILIVAGAVTILFKKLKQPLVLGYIMAGFIVSPHMPYTMSVIDNSDIKTWADIGVMFLLFSLGLDFSFKKIIKMGITPVITTLTIIFAMMTLGIVVGHAFGRDDDLGIDNDGVNRAVFGSPVFGTMLLVVFLQCRIRRGGDIGIGNRDCVILGFPALEIEAMEQGCRNLRRREIRSHGNDQLLAGNIGLLLAEEFVFRQICIPKVRIKERAVELTVSR